MGDDGSPFLENESVLGAILFFASRASDYCTGTQLVVDGGSSITRTY